MSLCPYTFGSSEQPFLDHMDRLATATATAPVWCISDARRPTDLEYFSRRYRVLTVRVDAPEPVRAQRGSVQSALGCPLRAGPDAHSCVATDGSTHVRSMRRRPSVRWTTATGTFSSVTMVMPAIWRATLPY